MSNTLSAAITFFAIILLMTPLLNMVMLADSLLVSGGLLFGIWIILIILSYLISKDSTPENKDARLDADKESRS